MHLDIVLPAHNEEGRIGRTLDRYRQALSDDGVRFLVALDGCSDRTAEIVRAHASADRRVGLLGFPKLGKGGVLGEALRASSAPIVGFVDADGATPPSELLRLAERTGDPRGADVAIASRRMAASVSPARRSLARRVTSAGFAASIRRLFDLPYADTQCGAKVMRRAAATRMVPLLSSRDFLFDVDLLLVARQVGFTVEEVPTVWIDQAGSKLDALGDARRMAASAVRLWLHHRVIPVEDTPDVEVDAVIDLVGDPGLSDLVGGPRLPAGHDSDHLVGA